IMNIAVDAQRLGDRRHDLRGFQVLIAGGTGGMGRLFANTLANRGASVKIFGRTVARNKEIADELGIHAGSYSDARQADLVIVSVSIAATLKVARRLASIMPLHSLLADLSSVKTGVADAVAKRTGRLEYVSLHPLFGPDVDNIRGQEIAAIPY